MQFLVLGPLVAVSDAMDPLELGTPKAHATLAVLLCRAGQVVSVDAIVDALWPERPPAAAVKNVQLYVHQLRRVLGDARRITRRSGGYLLAAEPGEIDAQRFTGLIGQHGTAAATGDLKTARSLLVQALGLWRGEQAYAGIGEVPPVAAEARRLAEARLAALSSRIGIDMRLGGHAELVPELVGLTGEHPLHERFWAQLMIVLHRSGRPAEALAAYDRARRIIAQETGLDPGAELRDLQQAILAGGAADLPSFPSLPPGWQERASSCPIGLAGGRGQNGGTAVLDVTPRMLPPDSRDFTGRLAELTVLTAALGDGQEPDGAARTACAVPMAALSGQGGVGKTALAVHAAHRLAGSYPDGQLFAELSGAQPAPADPDQVLARFLRALGVAGQAVPEAGAERAALYRSLVGGRRVLVVLDDAADEAQVRPLLPGAASCAVIVTSRARLGGLPGARHVDLAPLPAEDGLRLLQRIAGSARTASDPGASRQLAGLCAGLPLALRIAGSRLASRPHWSVGELAAQLADERKRLDALRHRDLEVRASFALSYHGLGPAEQRLFRLLGLLDAPDVAAWTAAALLDTSPAEAGQLLEILADARLVEVMGSGRAGQRRYRFHDLVRIYARELAESIDGLEARTAALTRAFGALLALTDAVRRAQDGGDYILIVGDAPRWRPAEAAAAVAASGSPVSLLRSERQSLTAAVRQAARLGLDETCWELATGGASLYQALAYYDDWRQSHQVALAATEAAGNARGRAMIELLLSSYHDHRRHVAESKDCANRAMALFDDIRDRYGYALALRRSAQCERHAGHLGEAISHAQEAGQLLAALGDPAAAADCLISEGMARFDADDFETAAEVLAQGVEAARAVGSRVLAAHGSYWLAQADLALGRHDAAAAAAAELADLVRVTDHRIGAVYSRHARGCLGRARGDLAAARLEMEAGLDAARQIHDPLMQARFLTDLGELCQSEAKHQQAASLLAAAATAIENLGFPVLRARALRRLAEARIGAGDYDGAWAAREKAAAIMSGMGLSAVSGPAR